MRHEIVVVGASLGGTSALKLLLGGIPAAFRLPLAIVLHRAAETGNGYARHLTHAGSLPVSEPEDKEPILAGHAYVAPAEYHLLVERGWFSLSTDEPVNHARPSVDVLFQTAADVHGKGVIAVVLTGSGRDGAQGAAAVHASGGLVIAQDPASAEARQMPEAAIAACPTAVVLALEDIAAFLLGLA